MENEDESKTKVEDTTTQTDSTEEVKTETQEVATTTQKTEESDEQVTISKAELEKIQKKAKDFDGIVSGNKGKKLIDKFKQKTDEDDDGGYQNQGVDLDEIRSEVMRVAEETALRVAGSVRQDEFKTNVISASEEWLKDNPWAEDDNVFKAVVENIKPTNSTNRDDILAELDRASLLAHPSLYMKHKEEKIRSQILSEQHRIDVGSGGSAPSVRKTDAVEVNATAEDQRIADKFFGGDLQKYLKHKKE